MTNYIVLVGRLVNDPTIERIENGKEISTITVAVTRSYKNADGEYDTDFIPVNLYKNIAEKTAEYCHKGDVIGIKGRMEFKEDKLEVIAEKVTFLSSSGKDEE